jgi:hypothetical protein
MLTVTTSTGQRIVYTSDMGDSPAAGIIIGGSMAANGAKDFVTSCSHKWDEEDEVQRYADNVWLKREAPRKRFFELYEHDGVERVPNEQSSSRNSKANQEGEAGVGARAAGATASRDLDPYGSQNTPMPCAQTVIPQRFQNRPTTSTDLDSYGSLNIPMSCVPTVIPQRLRNRSLEF